MMNFIKNKKAVSPLIATVLLIAFAVALGAVVMNWGRGYVEDTQDFARERSDAEVVCTTDIDLNIVSIDLTEQICYNSSDGGTNETNVSMILENVASRDINSLNIRVIGTDSKVPFTPTIANGSEEATEIDAGEAKLISFLYDHDDYGLISQIAVTPVIKLSGKDVTCSGNQLRLIGIRSCSEIDW
ncbi:archaellin/type IV pilin N-terminal domain-containing protein [Thermoproteota archaeon]